MKSNLLLIVTAFIIVGAIAWKINSLSNKVDYLNSVVETKNAVISNKELINKQLVKNRDEILEQLENLNLKYKTLNSDYNLSVKQLEVWKNKPAKIKYKTLYKKIYIDVNKTKLSNSNCKEGLKLLDKIRKINYNDL